MVGEEALTIGTFLFTFSSDVQSRFFKSICAFAYMEAWIFKSK